MPSSIHITDVVFTPASAALKATGMCGFIDCTVNFDLRLSGLTLRRTAAGALSLSFPEKIDSNGTRHRYMRPTDARARVAIERQIIGTLRARGAIR